MRYAQIARQLAALRKLQADLQSGKKLSSSERQLQARLDKYIGSGSGKNSNVIGKVVALGEGTMKALESWKHVDFLQRQPAGDPGYAITNPWSSALTVKPNFFSRSFSMMAQIVAHEGSHEKWGRTRDVFGPHSYGDKYAQRIAGMGSNYSLMNADNVAFALGFERDDD